MAPPPSRYEQPTGYKPKKKSGGIFGSITGAVKTAGRLANEARFSPQFVPNGGAGGQTLGDMFGDRWGSGGGGGGGDPYAAQRAEDERRRAAMRAAIQQQYGGAINQLGGQNTASRGALQQFYGQAQGRMNPIFAQNTALTGQYQKQLQGLTQNASRGVLDQGNMLARDLQSQGGGYGVAGLQGAVNDDVTDILGAGAAAGGFNNRLGQVMGTSQRDNAAMLSAILQGAQSSRENSYAAELARLRNAQAMGLAELA